MQKSTLQPMEQWTVQQNKQQTEEMQDYMFHHIV